MITNTDSTTLWELLADARITVPPIQRDYAQGRRTERVDPVRHEFARSLVSTLKSNKRSVQHLDFIYGTTHEDALRPIDGQQRLTTLFLLHWVLAARAGLLQGAPRSSGSAENVRESLKNFSYDNRIAATEFLRGLTDWCPATATSRSKENLAIVIGDQTWFTGRWRDDPTVSGMVEMIRALDRELTSQEDRPNKSWSMKLWKRLVEEKRITFAVLAVEELTPANPAGDDIYIKMNARGKALTEWEQFKNWFERHVDGMDDSVQVVSDWKSALDTRWTDLFWHYRDSENDLIDEEILRFFRLVATMDIAIRGDWSKNRERSEQHAQTLMSEDFIPVSWYEETNVFQETTVTMLFRLLDLLSVEPGVDDLNHSVTGRNNRREAGHWFFLDDDPLGTAVGWYGSNKKAAVPSLTERLHVAAFFLVALHVDFAEEGNARGWMRLLRNLIENSGRDRTDIGEWMESVNAFNSVLADQRGTDSPYGDSDGVVWHALKRLPERYLPQVNEEKKKTFLENDTSEGESWKQIFKMYEDHGFFRGRVLFGRELSETRSPAETDRILKFLSYIFGVEEKNAEWTPIGDTHYARKSLGDPSLFLFRRALLIHGDFSFYKGQNWCLVDNSVRQTTRRLQWYMEVLQPDPEADGCGRGLPALQSLLAALNVVGNRSNLSLGTIDNRLQRVIGSATAHIGKHSTSASDRRWREIVAKCPRCLWYAKGNNLRWATEADNPTKDGPIYVLHTHRLSGEYVELFTYALYQELCGPQWRPESDLLAYDQKTRKNGIPKIVWSNPETGDRLVEVHVDAESPGQMTVKLFGSDLVPVDSIRDAVGRAFGRKFAAIDDADEFSLPVMTWSDIEKMKKPFAALTGSLTDLVGTALRV